MKKITTAFLILFLGFVAVSCKTNVPECSETEENMVTVEIKSGKDQKIIKKTKWKKGMTALLALQTVSRVTTHPSGRFIFVTSIDGIDAEHTVTAWYYKVNGKNARELAVTNVLKKGDCVTWILKKDVCSRKIKKKTESKK